MSTVPEKAQNPFGRSEVAAVPGGGASAHALASREAQDIMVQMMCARQFRRDPLSATDRALNAFTRPELCEDGMYAYSRGGSEVSGLSIRAAEVLAQCWGNIRTGVAELTRGAGQSEFLAYAQDLETGFSDEKRFFVRHWRDTKTGGHAVKDERDIYEIGANMGARRKRACILAVIPKDVQDAVERQIEITLKQKADVTPEALKALVQAFEAYGVKKEHIEKRIQRRLESMLPAQLIQMRRIFASLKDGMSTAEEWFEINAPAQSEAPAGAQADSAAGPAASGTESVKDKLRSRTAAKDERAADHIPQFDAASAEKALRAAKSLKELETVMHQVREDFRLSKRELPLEAGAAYDEMREHFGEGQKL